MNLYKSYEKHIRNASRSIGLSRVDEFDLLHSTDYCRSFSYGYLSDLAITLVSASGTLNANCLDILFNIRKGL